MKLQYFQFYAICRLLFGMQFRMVNMTFDIIVLQIPVQICSNIAHFNNRWISNVAELDVSITVVSKLTIGNIYNSSTQCTNKLEKTNINVAPCYIFRLDEN